MPIDIRTATASDFDQAAHKQSTVFIMWSAITVLVASVFGWAAIVPAIFAVWSAISGIMAVAYAMSLRNGTFAGANPNNGAPDGDARNLVPVVMPIARSHR